MHLFFHLYSEKQVNIWGVICYKEQIELSVVKKLCKTQAVKSPTYQINEVWMWFINHDNGGFSQYFCFQNEFRKKNVKVN